MTPVNTITSICKSYRMNFVLSDRTKGSIEGGSIQAASPDWGHDESYLFFFLQFS